jgi:histidinol-phosphate aminotransferase
MGAEVLRQVARAEDKFNLKVVETATLIRLHRPKGIFLCQPNNPTGQYFTKEEVEAILDASPDTLLVLDEAYIVFVDDAWASLDLIQRDNVIILRSMTKDYGLTGLRLGYLVAGEEILSHLRHVCPPWNVNIAAQKAGIAALAQNDYLEKCRNKVREAKQYLVAELESLGFTVLPSRANFFLVQVGNAAEFRAKLLKQGIMARDCTSFGLPEYVRIAPRTMPECRKLIAAIRSLK